MSVEAVVFDIGNVLIEWRPERLYDARIGTAQRQLLMDQVPLHAINLEIDRGQNLHSAIETLAKAHPGWATEIRWWRDDWLEMAQPAIDRSVRMMRALQAGGVPVFALSNFGIETFEIAQAAYPFLHEFDQAFISGHMKVIKPEPAIYAALERETGVAPKRLLFIDDRAENIAAAQERGWQGHLFDGADGLAKRFVAEGLLNERDAA